jgi:predicted TIM-barrel fold metal-dependent hydrolase
MPLTAPAAIRMATLEFDFQTVRKMIVRHAVDKGCGAFRGLAAPFSQVVIDISWHDARFLARLKASSYQRRFGQTMLAGLRPHGRGRVSPAAVISCRFGETLRMADIPLVDTHFHLHDLKRSELRYAWLEPEAIHGFLGDIDALKAQHYWIDDYLAEIRFSNVPKAIHVQAALGVPDPVDETRWLQAFANKVGYPHGIVAECHLANPDAEAVLERHMQFPNVRGVRDFGDGRYLVDGAWRAGFKFLRQHNLVSCIDTRIQHFDDLLDLAAAFPDTQICVDHCAIPEARDDAYFERWLAALKALARAQNVAMKISGLGMMDRRWTIDSLRPWVLGSIEAFGVDRVVFGTNWPVDRMFSSYPDIVNAYAKIIAGFSRDEQMKMFSHNAEIMFRI